MRTQSPIYTTEKLSAKPASYFRKILKKKRKKKKVSKHKHLDEYSTKELKERLEEAIRTEAYEKAALIQQELKKREQKQG
ncbi:MAG: hypothetical protein ACLTTW_01295 [Coprobacter sp.]